MPRGDQLSRQWRLIQLIDRPQGITVDDEARDLAVTIRTVWRDLDVLQKAGFPLYTERAADGKGLGLFVRSLVGLDRESAKEAMAGFITGKALSANQLEFMNLVVDHLTEHGIMQPARLYESPFADITPRGPDGLFKPAELDELLRSLDAVRASAVAA
jgi:type I site-specific restriction endonuclease